jgi:hypothetical protein
VGGSLRQATDFSNQLFPAQLPRFFYGLSCDQLRDRRAAGHRWNAALGAKAYFSDALPSQFQSEFQNVSASGVFQARGAVGSFNLARVSRVLKMVEEFGGIHRAIVMRGRVISVGVLNSFTTKDTKDLPAPIIGVWNNAAPMISRPII